MFEGKTFLALIPARGGSKGLPGKNVRMLGDKALIGWSIAAAKASRYVDGCIVSTDDDAITAVSLQCGAEVPFKRPAEIASDTAKMMDVIAHAFEFLGGRGKHYDYLVLLQPTSPFRTGKHIDEAIELLHARQAKVVLGVTQTEHSPLLANTLPTDGNMGGFYPAHLQTLNRQDMAPYYRLNGGIYVADWKFLLEGKKWITPDTYAYVMDRRSSIDIDHIEDFLLAEALLNHGHI